MVDNATPGAAESRSRGSFEGNARAAGIAVTGIGLDESEFPAIPVWDFTKESLVLQNVVTQSQASVVTGAASLVGKLIGPPGGAGTPRIDSTETYREGALVYVRVRYSGDADGFGFRGANGAGWAEEAHPFTDPSYGRVTPGQVDYPFNHDCGGDGESESDVEFWVYGDGGRSEPVIIHLSC